MASFPRRLPLFRRLQLRLLGIYPPYLGAGIRVKRLGPAHYRTRLKLRFYNENLFGTHFGGSLYSMCDPFFALCLVEKLGPEWIVWDKAASIRFRKPGRGTVTAEFSVPDERVEAIRREATEHGRAEPVFTVQVLNGNGEVVAEVEKVVFVKPRGEPGPHPPD
jgi:acyl-coenzyme A thioesterase PaaI-like protein